jgi:hypothetical protein
MFRKAGSLMPILSILIAIVLGVLALAFVLYPLYRRPAERRTGVIDHALEDHAVVEDSSKLGEISTRIAEGEQAARNALQEVELDFQLGNITETDYRTLRERYIRRALIALKLRYEREQELDEAIEEQLRLMKEKKQHVE